MDASPNIPSPRKTLAVALTLALGATGMATPVLADRASGATDDPVAPLSRPDGSILWPVTNCNDAGSGSLRYAASHAVDGDGIDLTGLACSTITLSSGEITLHDVEVTGPGPEALSIDGSDNQGERIFNHMGHSGELHLRGLTLHGSKYESVSGQGGGCLRSQGASLNIKDAVFDGCIVFAPSGSSATVRGGAIAAYVNRVSLDRVTLTNNLALAGNGAASGGAAYLAATGVAGISLSNVSNNSATTNAATPIARGGGLFVHGWGIIIDSTIDGNVAEGEGGGVLFDAGGMIHSSTVSNNKAIGNGAGAAFHSEVHAEVEIAASTISGNEAEQTTLQHGGALYVNVSPTRIRTSTIAGNLESNQQGIACGAGILFGPDATSGLTMVSSIVYGNHYRDNPLVGVEIGGQLGTTLTGDHNLIGVVYVHVPTDTIRWKDPQLGPLQDNGGPTWTRLPTASSPVIDQGFDDWSLDQRGFPRVLGLAADIGAVEAGTSVIFEDGFD